MNNDLCSFISNIYALANHKQAQPNLFHAHLKTITDKTNLVNICLFAYLLIKAKDMKCQNKKL